MNRVGIEDPTLLDISGMLGDDWQELAIYLGFDEVNFREFHVNDPGNVHLQKFQMLIAWRNRQPSTEGQMGLLCRALKKIHRYDIAEWLQGGIEDPILSDISEKLGDDWKELAIHLGFDDAKIREFEVNNPGNVLHQKFKMLTEWRRRQPSTEDQMDVLCRALKNINRNDIVEWLRHAYRIIERTHILFGPNIISTASKNAVFRATWTSPSGKQTVAAKRCDEFREEEVSILASLNHNNIIKFLGVVKPSSSTDSTFIVTEFAEQGSLYDVIARHREEWPEYRQSRWMKWAQDGARALQFIHQKGYQHGDVKSPNFLVTSDDVLKICDFGISRKYVYTVSTISNRGTGPWMAPEVIGKLDMPDPSNSSEPCKVTQKSDVYSFGVVIWELLSGEVPYSNQALFQILTAIVDKGERLKVPSNCPEYQQMNELLNKCWQAEYQLRPDMDEVLQILKQTERTEH